MVESRAESFKQRPAGALTIGTGLAHTVTLKSALIAQEVTRTLCVPGLCQKISTLFFPWPLLIAPASAGINCH